MVIPSGQQSSAQLARAEAAADRAAAATLAAHAEPYERADSYEPYKRADSYQPYERADSYEPQEPEHDEVAAAVKLDAEEAAALEDTPPPPPEPVPEPEPEPEPAPAPAPPEKDMAETVSSATATRIGLDTRPAALPLAKLQVLSGAFAGRELELTKALTTLGRPGVQVAAITRRAEGYYIVHVESGQEGDFPLVNGRPIGAQARKLSDNDVVQLAGVKMGFFAA